MVMSMQPKVRCKASNCSTIKSRYASSFAGFKLLSFTGPALIMLGFILTVMLFSSVFFGELTHLYINSDDQVVASAESISCSCCKLATTSYV